MTETTTPTPLTPGALLDQAAVDAHPHRRTIERTGDRLAATTVLMSSGPDTDAPAVPTVWALAQRHVSGWTCIASGEVAGPGVLDEITYFYADGFERLADDHYGVTGSKGDMIHILREPGTLNTYCDSLAAGPYVPGVKDRNGRAVYRQHCTGCTTAYRAAHYGRCPVEAH